MIAKPPYAYSYWVVPGKLLAGAYPGELDRDLEEERLKALLGTGVTLIVNLMEESETENTWKASASYEPVLAKVGETLGARVRVARHPVQDFSVPTVRDMRTILDEIRAELKAGGVVYVHCYGGIGRTGTVIGCYLADMGEPDALAKLADLTGHERYFNPTPHTEGQREFVRHWRVGT